MVRTDWPSLDRTFGRIWRKVRPYTMTSVQRGYALYRAVNHIVDNKIPGALVECGVWKGGSAMLMALTLIEKRAFDRNIILFDTFEGMTGPDAQDVDLNGLSARALMDGVRGADIAELVRAEASLDEVRANLESTGFNPHRIRYVKGDVCETLARTQTSQISLLRLDTDFYDSTLCELEVLYPRLSEGGILIIDDYGHWQGCRRAVDAFFERRDAKPFLWPIDYTGVGLVKSEPAGTLEIERYDRTPPGYAELSLAAHFPHLREMNPYKVAWPHLRKSAPHIFRVDERNEKPWPIGVASHEEAMILHAHASLFRGKRALEIGAHFGWTTAYILAAGVALDSVDPAFLEEKRFHAVEASLKSVAPDGAFTLWPGYSPDLIGEVRSARDNEPFSFVFIDGNHDGDAPFKDATETLKHCAADAMVMLHDLASPDVARGLDVFCDAGWNTRVYNTMQIMGVAWRGAVEPPHYESDPNVPYPFYGHLKGYEIW